MKWSTHSLMWGRPLRSIFAVFNKNKLSFQYQHLQSSDIIIIENDLEKKSKRINNFKDYFSLLKANKIILDQNERQNITWSPIEDTELNK